jgi:lipid A 3-O-deacylase
MNKSRRGALCAFSVAASLGMAAATLTGPAQAETPSAETGTLSILFENDIFYHTDRDYSNGVQIGWTTAPDDTPEWAVDVARSIPFFGQSGEVRTSYAIGQNIYTPSNLHLVDPPLTDRPYAGYLYFAMGVSQMTETDLDQLQVQLGVVGPDSLAEESQKFVHSLLKDTNPQGWGTQLHNEPGLVINDEHSWRAIATGSLLGLSFDIDPHVGAAVGNVYDYVNAGAMGRFGLNLPDDYGPTRIDPSLPGTNFFEPTAGISAYVFGGFDGRAVARNIFLDGNTWEDSRHVTRIPCVGDMQLGAAIAMDSWRLTFTHVFRTKEYETQKRADQFGAVNLSIRF